LEDGVDVAIRFGPLAATWRRQRLLIHGRYHLYASPTRARALQDLTYEEMVTQAPCLVLHATHLRDRWPFLGASGLHWLGVKPALTCDDVDALIQLMVVGTGIGLMADFLVQPQVTSGDLVVLTRKHEATPCEVFALSAAHEDSERVRALIDHLAAWIKTHAAHATQA